MFALSPSGAPADGSMGVAIDGRAPPGAGRLLKGEPSRGMDGGRARHGQGGAPDGPAGQTRLAAAPDGREGGDAAWAQRLAEGVGAGVVAPEPAPTVAVAEADADAEDDELGRRP